MRYATLSLLTILLLTSAALAQRSGPQFRRPLACEPLEPRTKLEEIEGRYATVVIKGFTQIASLNLRGADVRIDAVELKEANSSTRATGVVIALRESGDRAAENRAFIDYQEIEPLLRALDAVSKVNESATKLVGFEARYRTLGDLEINVFRQSRASGTAASLSAGICERVTALLTIDDLERIKAHVTEARSRLDELR